jgi:peptide deformylase
MAIRQILRYPNSQLRERTQKIDFADPDWDELSYGTFLDLAVKDSFDTLYGVDRGAALAANQVGFSQRFFVINKNQKIPGGLPLVICNPEVISKSTETTTEVEGCLSFPGIQVPVRRPLEVQVRYQDTCGVESTVQLDGWLARVFQHEIDHLDGTLFVDYLSDKKRVEIANKMMGK